MTAAPPPQTPPETPRRGSPDAAPEPLSAEALRAKTRITLLGAAVNLPLGLGKMALGWLGGSQALVADGVHSLSDLISDAVTWAALRGAARGPDDHHPWGHGRIETLATLAVALLLALTAAGLVLGAAARLAEAPPAPEAVTLAAALASIAVKEALFRLTRRVARRTGSGLIAANAWHHRSDALSSVVAVVGIGGALAGAAWLDGLAAIVIAVMLGHAAWAHGWPALRELSDVRADDAALARIDAELAAVPGVRGTRELRARRMGPATVADLSVLLDPRISLSEAHRISEAAKARLIGRIDELADVVVHAEPAGHAEGAAALAAPLRAEIAAALAEAWADLPEAGLLGELRLDYLGDGIEAEVTAPYGALADPEALAVDLSARARARAPALRALRLRLAVAPRSE